MQIISQHNGEKTDLNWYTKLIELSRK